MQNAHLGRSLFISCLIVFAMQNFLPAQSIEWQNTIGGSLNDGLNCIRQTSDSGYICGATSRSYISGDKTEATNGFQDYWIFKLDASGDILWQNDIGGSQIDVLSYIEQTSDGGYICGGRSNSPITGDKTEACLGLNDFWIVKLDAAGNIQWQNTIGGSDDDWLLEIHQTMDGGYIAGGHSRSDISGDKTENTNGQEDYWVVKLNAAGNIQWQNTIGGSSQDFMRSIIQTSNGDYFCGGHSSSGISGDKTEVNNNTDYWIMRLDSSGNILWQNTIGGTNYDRLISVLQTPEGGFVLGGYSYSPEGIDKTENSIDYDSWIIKVDSAGNIEWQNTFGGDTSDFIQSMNLTHDGGFVCGMESLSGKSVDKSESSNGESDFWVVKLDKNGRIKWQNNFGGSLPDEIFYVEETYDGGIICGGYSESDISGDKNENSQGGTDCWIVKLWGKINLIKGNVFADLNLNSVKDAGENLISSLNLTEINTGRFAFTDMNGNYQLGVLDAGNFMVEPQVVNYYTSVPSNRLVSFTQVLQTDSLNDFAFQPTGINNDLDVFITPTSQYRSGFTASYMINYSNVGTTTLNPVVVFYNDPNQSVISSIPVASSITSDSSVFALGPILPYQFGQILVTVYILPGLVNGFVLNAGTKIFPVANDVNPLNNSDYSESIITGSYDPNDILVNTDTLFNYQLNSPPYLEYTIRFQNTGTDTALFINIENKIPPNLLINSVEILASSHACEPSYRNYDSTLIFQFDNCMLPDSNVNERESHGFIRYRILPVNTLVVGDSILNTAAIFFDYNAPVITNTAITEAVMVNHMNDAAGSTSKLHVFPNPSKEYLQVLLPQTTSPYKLEIFNAQGVKMFEDNGTLNLNSIINLNITNHPAGIYFIRFVTESSVCTAKWEKQ